jgi:hypothetical protein
MGDGSAGSVECACVHGDRPAVLAEDPGVVCDRAAVAHTVAHACAAATWTLSSFLEDVVDAQFLVDPLITGGAPSIQTDACDRAEQMPGRSPDLRTDRTASASLADDGPDKRRVPFYLSARQSVFVSIRVQLGEKKLFLVFQIRLPRTSPIT